MLTYPLFFFLSLSVSSYSTPPFLTPPPLLSASDQIGSEASMCGFPLSVPMAKLTLISLNVRGLYAPGKRHNLFREMDRLRADIVFLQETHHTQLQ